MKKLRVLALINEYCQPPESIEGLKPEEIICSPWKTEYDVIHTLEKLDHQVKTLCVSDELAPIRKSIQDFKPHIVFNLLEEFSGVTLYDQNVVSYLELLHITYTGCNPRGLMIAQDKALSKKILAYHRILVPKFYVIPFGKKKRRPKHIKLPLFIKSATEHSSSGISQASLVKDEESLQTRVEYIHQLTGADAIAEEFIEGRELYVGMIGNKKLEVLPVWELLFEQKPEEAPLIATARAKWNLKYQKKWGIVSQKAENLPQGFNELIERHCKRIYRLLGLSGYARFDFRLSPEGRLYFLEANPNPDLSENEDFSQSANKKGVSYEKLIQHLVNLGLQWRPIRI